MDSQRLILFFVFSFSVFLLLDAWQRDQLPATPPAAVGDQAGKAGPPAAQPPVPSEKLAMAPPAVPGQERRAAEAGAPLRIETDLYIAELNTLGGDLRRLQLKKHRDTLDHEKDFVLFEVSPERTYIAQAGLIGGNLPNHRTLYAAAAASYPLADGQDRVEVRLVAPPGDGVQVTKVYRFHRGSYLVDVSFEIDNKSGTPLQPYAYFQIVRDGKPPAGDSAMLPTFTGVAAYTEKDKFQKATFADIDKGKTAFPKNSNDGWIAVLQHYFFSA